MRYLLVLFIAVSFTSTIVAQGSKIDSLSHLLIKEKADTNRVTVLWRLAEQYQFFKPDTALQLAQQALLLAQRIQYTEGESRSLAILATAQYMIGNYPSALNNYMQKLKIEEKRNSPRNYASALNNIGLMYILLGEYNNALDYLYRADSTIETAGDAAKAELKYNITGNIGEAYYRMNKADSAKQYFTIALSLAEQSKDSFSLGASLLGIANVLQAQQQYADALQHYLQAFHFLNNGLNNEMLCEATLGMAKVYDEQQQPDSAAYYALKSFNTAAHDHFLSRQLDAASFLSTHYKKKQLFDSAFFYLEQASALQDSIKGQDKTREATIISNNEQMRQAELAEQKIRDKEARFQQLQMLGIAIFIPLFFLLTLVISRIRIHVLIIKFMGIISLLLVFEFLTLLLHPAVAELTHHVPILELLIFVCIAAVLIPLHHRLEHLLIEKITKGKHRPGTTGLKPKTIKLKIKK
ncbi:MAG: tetratricopeptide repeat protein [Bacteroidetes bacterium]|nr:tetratricopeptide repeat protein [Bacteroidota bacterium]